MTLACINMESYENPLHYVTDSFIGEKMK